MEIVPLVVTLDGETWGWANNDVLPVFYAEPYPGAQNWDIHGFGESEMRNRGNGIGYGIVGATMAHSSKHPGIVTYCLSSIENGPVCPPIE